MRVILTQRERFRICHSDENPATYNRSVCKKCQIGSDRHQWQTSLAHAARVGWRIARHRRFCCVQLLQTWEDRVKISNQVSVRPDWMFKNKLVHTQTGRASRRE